MHIYFPEVAEDLFRPFYIDLSRDNIQSTCSIQHGRNFVKYDVVTAREQAHGLIFLKILFVELKSGEAVWLRIICRVAFALHKN